MRHPNSRIASSLAGFLAIAGIVAAMAQPAHSQRMPSTLRYGSGLIDIPTASVLPHLTFTGTYSGFTASIPEFVIVDPHGHFITPGPQYEKWLADGSVAIGLFDRIEVGASLQHFADEEEGGNLLGGFGRLSLLPSSVENLDLAVGARWAKSPTFGSRYQYDFQPNRLGYPDSRLHKDVGHDGEFSSNWTPYAVATAHLPVSEASAVSLTAGWGSGLFAAGGDLEDFHDDGGGSGIFGGAGAHIGIGGNRQLNLMAEFNSFEVNGGVQVDLGYVRLGAFALGLFHDGSSTFRSRKLGVLASVAMPTVKADTVITPYTVVRADTAITQRMVVTADTSVVGRLLPDNARRTVTTTVLFLFDQDEITEEGQAMLMEKANVMRANPVVELSVEGHADDIGDSQYNYDLGMARANNVVEFLTSNGIAAGRLSAMSHGEEMPVVETRSFREMAPNRRVEFVITAEETQETVITADTTMVPDTTITERTIEMADTVVTPSRWGSNTTRNDDSLGAAGDGMAVEVASADAGVTAHGPALRGDPGLGRVAMMVDGVAADRTARREGALGVVAGKGIRAQRDRKRMT